jgi:hypothetical protein
MPTPTRPEPGEFCRVILADGRPAAVEPLLFDAARLIVCDPAHPRDITDQWFYPNAGAAIYALSQWDGTGEPAGWHRHPTSGRRRPDGDAVREYVHL